MNRVSYTSTLLAVAIVGYSGGAVAQQSCQSEIQQLRSENQQRQVDENQRRQVTQLLDRAQRADASECQQLVTQARQQLERTQGQNRMQQSSSQAQPQVQQQNVSPAQTQQQTGGQYSQAPPSGLAGQEDETTMDVKIEQMPANVEVNSAAPQVVVKQQPPKVTVEQQPPIVEITQPEAKVNVQQAEPKVTVNQAEPQVDIRQAEPQVEVVQAGEPEVRMISPQSEGARSTSQLQQGSGTATGQVQQSERLVSTGGISSEEAAQLVGKNALSSEGEDIGEISAIVRSRTNNELHAVVDVGGFFGIGERSIALPVQRGEIGEDGNLQVPYSREQLERLAEYDPRQYEQYEQQ